MSEGTSPRWLAGLRRGLITSGALARWVDDRGLTGVVHTPAGYVVDDAGEGLVRLIEAGAKPDRALLWDLAVADLRSAADVLVDAYRASGTVDGYVAVWIDPARAGDPEKAVAAAAEIVGDVRRANLAVALAWTPQRAAVVQALVRNDCPVALSGVRDDDSAAKVAAAREFGMRERLEAVRKDDPDAEVPDVPVFLLGSSGSHEGTTAVELVTEFDIFTGRASGRVPLSADAEEKGVNIAVDAIARRAKEPAHDDAFTPIQFESAVEAECRELNTDEVLEDLWSRDHTLWKEDAPQIAERLGWLDVADRMQGELVELAEFARKARASADVRHVVLLGMGGSVLAAQTLHEMLSGSVPLIVLDTTHPAHIERVRDSIDADKTLFVVGSKSGTTIETRSHLEYFWSLVGRGDRFVCITDPGTELAGLASERGFLRVFENPPDIGGRYSALSYFGLVPALLGGCDVGPALAGARRQMTLNGPGGDASVASGTRLGAALGESVRKLGRDKLTLVLPPALAALGPWIEQLIAESTGKLGRGVLPVVSEPLAGPEVYGADRLFCAYSAGDQGVPPQIEALEEHGIVRIGVSDARAVGAEMFRWEMATAILGYLLDIDPFDQPDVESAKVRAREALGAGTGSRPDAGDARALLADLAAPSYIAIQAFVDPSEDNAKRLEAARVALRDEHKVAVTTGFGPRFLHSTGQYHKGGPNNGVFLQVVDERTADIDIPGTGYSFGRLIDAQADGDLLALRDGGRNAARLTLALLTEIAGVG